MNQYMGIIISLAMLLFIIYNQFRTRPVSRDVKLTMPLIMLILGLYSFNNFLDTHQLTSLSWMSIALSFTILAIGMASIRASTVKLWVKDGIVYRKGTLLTLFLWLVSIILHQVLNHVGHVGESTTPIYFSITFTLQKMIVKKRAERILS